MTATARTEHLLGILQDCFKPREEGWLWLALFAEVEGGVVQQITGEYEGVRETAWFLAEAINRCRPDHAFVAISREDGRPTESDRELWRDLRGRVDPDVLVDLVVFNRDERWSMRGEDAGAVPLGAAGEA